MELLFADDNPTNLKVYTTIAARIGGTLTRLMRAVEYRDNGTGYPNGLKGTGSHFDPTIVEALFCCKVQIEEILQTFTDATVAA